MDTLKKRVAWWALLFAGVAIVVIVGIWARPASATTELHSCYTPKTVGTLARLERRTCYPPPCTCATTSSTTVPGSTTTAPETVPPTVPEVTTVSPSGSPSVEAVSAAPTPVAAQPMFTG